MRVNTSLLPTNSVQEAFMQQNRLNRPDSNEGLTQINFMKNSLQRTNSETSKTSSNLRKAPSYDSESRQLTRSGKLFDPPFFELDAKSHSTE